MAWTDQIDRVLFTQQQIAARVDELARQVQHDYCSLSPTLIGILTGSFVFMADLLRRLDFDLRVDFMAVSSYEDGTVSSGKVRITKDLDHDIAGKHLLIIEDIIDTGQTLKQLTGVLADRGPASIRLCCLLDKPSRRVAEISADYTGFTIPDAFVVGYGLDYAQAYRHLPYIAVLKPQGD